jgi:exonuclease SbcC
VAGAVETSAEAGFPDLASARSAVLAPRRRAELELLLSEREAEAIRARAILDDASTALGAQEWGDGTEVDVAERAEQKRTQLAAAREAAAAADRAHHLTESTVAALDGSRRRLEGLLEDWAPMRDASLRAASMARLVRGMGADNELQMRLSAYVLAQRLDQVVAAANERLGHMRDQRYLLQRTDRAGRRGSQAGLGLEVVDQWTGDVRDPATLSGGETFVVSLSLALGLSDVVTAEAGGTEISTLFVDEGFGTLDADTLDDVMDRLDGLRAGGRTVGVVSHVSELRTRIPTQVHVDKGRSGSTVTAATFVG